MSEAVMKDLNTVLIDGTPAGGLVDAVLNNRDAAGAIHDAFVAWLAQHDLDLAAAVKAEADNAAAVLVIKHGDELEALQAQLRQVSAVKDDFRAMAEHLKTQFQEAAGANQKLNAKVNELQGQLNAATNLAYQLMNGTTEQAVAALREWSRMQAISIHAGAVAQLAEHERLSNDAKPVEQPAA